MVRIFLNILGYILIIGGGIVSFLLALWPLTGNHGATWGQFAPIIAPSVGVLIAGIVLVKYVAVKKGSGSEISEEKT